MATSVLKALRISKVLFRKPLKTFNTVKTANSIWMSPNVAAERRISTQSNMYAKRSSDSKRRDLQESHSEEEEEPASLAVQEIISETEELEFQELVKRSHWFPGRGHQVLVIQPYVKWGPAKKRNTTPALMLEEALALIDSIPRWTTVDSMTISLTNLDKKTLFGKGNLGMLQRRVKENPNITAVFLSVNRLRGFQRRELEKIVGVSVLDRYSVVLQIFKDRAQTREAKLQVSLAEIPYFRSVITDFEEGSEHKGSGNLGAIGGAGETLFDIRRRLLANRERKIKQELEKLHSQRSLLKSNRVRREFPVVAVVGYTNAGKTSLIKSLTGDASLQPRDALFATLDVTSHLGYLPSRLPALFIDTVGFVADIPTALIGAFMATLDDALDADIIIHVQDVSHPDLMAQIATVHKTLALLRPAQDGVNFLSKVIPVLNKIDKLDEATADEHRKVATFVVSAASGEGLATLLREVEDKVLETTGRHVLVFRVPSGGLEYRWLYKEAVVSRVEADPTNEQLILMTVVLTPSLFSKIRHQFPHLQYRKP